MFAEVILAKATQRTDKTYHYSVPEALKDKLQIGHQVIVPFGKRQEIGYVIGFVEKAEVEKVKDLVRLAADEPIFSEQAVKLARWMAEYYCSFFITALRLFMPSGTRGKESQKSKSA